MGTNVAPVYRVGLSKQLTSEENEVVQILDRSGPVLAIGRPREVIPPLGAARIYVHDEDWQNLVRVLTYFARIVFLRVGDTSGFIWELRHLRTGCDPLKLLLFFPPTSGGKRNKALDTVETELKVSLHKIAALRWRTMGGPNHSLPFWV